MEEGYIDVYVPVTKKYNVHRITFRSQTFTGDCRGLAYWYYMNVNIHCSNLTIYIHGGIHNTFPNKEHLTVEFEGDGIRSHRYHMSVDDHGMYYSQNLMGAKKKDPKKKDPKKKDPKKKSSKKKSSN